MSTDESAEKRKETARWKLVFGLSYLWQGAGDLVATPKLFFIKYVLQLNDQWGQVFTGATTIGWLIKPLWGYISDRFPIGGRRRKPYFILMSIFAACAWISGAIGVWTGHAAPLYFFVIFNFASVGAAFVDVAGDALMVEHGQRLNLVSKFVNHQWTMYALASSFAGFVGGWLAGHAQKGDVTYGLIFAIAAILPLVCAFAGWHLIKEAPQTQDRTKKDPVAKKTTARRTLREFTSEHRVIIALFCFIFMWNFSPSFGYIEQSYLIDKRGFTPEIFGTLAAISGITFLLSIMCYRWTVRRFKTLKWQHWLYAMIAIGIMAIPTAFFSYLENDHSWWKSVDALIPSWLSAPSFLPDWNRYVWFRLATGTLLGFATIPAFMIPLQIAGKGISRESAGLQYALLMSISNFSHTLDDILGGALYGWLFQPEIWTGLSHWILVSFQGSLFEIAKTVDRRALILELFIWVGTCFTILTIPFVMWVHRLFRQQGVAIDLNEGEAGVK